MPQIGGMYEGDMSRKRNLVDFGFRLPSAVDNRPLTWEEFADRIGQTVYLSATPGPYELNRTGGEFVEQVIRPTGLVDPHVVVKPTKGQIDDLVHEIRARTERDERVLVTTLTKKMSEDLTDYLLELGIRVRYLHSEVDTLRRVELLRQLRLGEFDVLVGINLLREGLDLPEVSLVAILDADKEGFLRSGTSLIQTIGRAARNVSGEVHMYADKITDSMRYAIDETERRRAKQIAYNEANGIDPQPLRKKIADILDQVYREADDTEVPVGGSGRNASRGKRAAGEPGRAAELGDRRGPRHREHAPRRAGGPGAAAVRPDAGRGPRPAVRAGGAAARRDRRPEEGAAGDGRRRGPLTSAPARGGARAVRSRRGGGMGGPARYRGACRAGPPPGAIDADRRPGGGVSRRSTSTPERSARRPVVRRLAERDGCCRSRCRCSRSSLTGMLLYTRGYHIDLEVYRLGVATWLAGGDMYGPLPPTVSGLALPFIYPPFAAMVLLPLELLPWTAAWIALYGASLVSARGHAVRRRRAGSGPPAAAAAPLSVASVALPVALLLEPVLETFEFGQVNLVLMALVAVDCLAERTRWPRGLLVGLAAAIKLTPAAFVLFFLLRRDRRAAVVTIGHRRRRDRARVRGRRRRRRPATGSAGRPPA